MSQRDRDRLAVLRQVRDGLISAARGSEVVGLSLRQFRRLRRRWEAEGDGAVIHGLRDRRSNRAAPTELRARVMARVQEPVFRDFGPTLLAEHLSRDPAIGELNAHTLRGWMIEDGKWKPRRRGARHRKARPRRAALGELIQWDSSEHEWFEKRVAGRQVLIQMHDDATNRLMMARFVPRDNGPANRRSRSTTSGAGVGRSPSTRTRRATSAAGPGPGPAPTSRSRSAIPWIRPR